MLSRGDQRTPYKKVQVGVFRPREAYPQPGDLGTSDFSPLSEIVVSHLNSFRESNDGGDAPRPATLDGESAPKGDNEDT